MSDKGIGMLNICRYFDPLMKFFEHGVQEGFIRPEHCHNLVVDPSVEQLLDRIGQFKPISMEKWIRDIHEESK
jgi:predicted Rossmann-fold nucleotide-binding protein